MTPLERLYRYAEQGSILVCIHPVGFSPAVTFKNQGSYDIVLDCKSLRSEFDERELLLHELSHIAVGAFYRPVDDICRIRQLENRATRWLARTLVPRCELVQVVRSGITEPWELAEYFEISEELMREILSRYQADADGKEWRDEV